MALARAVLTKSAPSLSMASSPAVIMPVVSSVVGAWLETTSQVPKISLRLSTLRALGRQVRVVDEDLGVEAAQQADEDAPRHAGGDDADPLTDEGAARTHLA